MTSNVYFGSSERVISQVAVLLSPQTRSLCPAWRTSAEMSPADAVGLPSMTWTPVMAAMVDRPSMSPYSTAQRMLAGFLRYAAGRSPELASSRA